MTLPVSWGYTGWGDNEFVSTHPVSPVIVFSSLLINSRLIHTLLAVRYPTSSGPTIPGMVATVFVIPIIVPKVCVCGGGGGPEKIKDYNIFSSN